MDKPNRFWLLIAGIAVAIAIAVSAILLNKQEPSSQTGEGPQKKRQATGLPATYMKKIGEQLIHSKLPK